jgi:peptide/nickel transport system substrate-binding protein/oligopeptide transport system substrate-binding protein
VPTRTVPVHDPVDHRSYQPAGWTTEGEIDMGHRIRRAALVAGVLGLLAACSSDGDDTVADSTAGTADTTATADTATTDGATADTSAVTTGDTSGAVAGSGGSFSVNISEPAAIDPALASEVEGAQVIRLLFETLVSLSPDLEVVPGVATEWSVADDEVTWTFQLDPTATFSDGTPVDAADFVFAFARSADPDLAAPASYQGGPIEGWDAVMTAEASGAIGDEPVSGVTAIDDHTLQIVTNQPFALLPKLLTYPVFAPIPSELADDADALAAFGEQPIGNGPYQMDGAWAHNEGITVVRSPSFHGTPGIPDRIEFRIYSDMLTSYRDFQAGTLDIVRGIPPEEYQNALSEYGERVLRTSIASLFYIGLPVARAPFDDLDFRMALSMSIDREALVERVLQGASDVATGMVPPQVPGALQEACEACVFDLDAAKDHFAASGVEPGTTIVLYDIADDGQDVIEFLTNTWKDAFDLDVEVRSFEFAQFLEETAADKVEGPFELGWVWDYPSGYSILQPLFATGTGANNLSYSNAEFDDLMAQVEVATDDAAASDLLGQAQAIVEADLPLIPLTFASDLGVINERVGDVQVDAGALWRLELVTVTD